MSFKPIFSYYLLSGTGMDMNNSIWWHRWAYTADKGNGQGWWSNCYRWFKSHSIGHGTWYAMHIDPVGGILHVGRTPLKDPADEPVTCDTEIGQVTMDEKMNDVTIPFSDVIANVDYMIFQGDNEQGGITPVYYCFVDSISYVNWNTAEITYTCDALMTYQKQFCFGKCNVLRDMQAKDYNDYETRNINVPGINTEAEPFQFTPSDLIVTELKDLPELVDLNDLGAYGAQFCTTDIDISEPTSISPNSFNPAFAGFLPSEATRGHGDSIVGIGLYYMPSRQNPVMRALGAYNAFEHILSTYCVPLKLVSEQYRQTAPNNNNPVFIPNCDDAINKEFEQSSPDEGESKYKVPIYDHISDTADSKVWLTNPDSAEFIRPLNPKCLIAPYNYISISDKQGGSLEILPQLLTYSNDDTPGEAFKAYVKFRPSVAPQVLSMLYIDQYMNIKGSKFDPLTTLWQLNCYAMTPNNSGYGMERIEQAKMQNVAKQQFVTGVGFSLAGGAVKGLGKYGGAAALASGSVGGLIAGNLAGSAGKMLNTIGGGYLGSAVATENNMLANAQNILYDTAYGLPGVTGGVPGGQSRFTLEKVGYSFFQIHLKASFMKALDYFFSIYGYAQNRWRFPHINTRRRWTYVQCGDISIIPIQADDQVKGGVPYWARQQITARMQQGVTFWNIRQAMMGDEDGTDAPPTFSEYDDPITSCNFMQFVKRYGDNYNSEIMKENAGLSNPGYPGQDLYTDDSDTEP